MNTDYIGLRVFLNKFIGFAVGLFFLLIFGVLGKFNLEDFDNILRYEGVWYVVFVVFYEILFLIISVFSFRYAITYSKQKEKKKIQKEKDDKKKLEKQAQISTEEFWKADKKKRKNYPHYISEVKISLVSLALTLLGTVGFWILWLIESSTELFIAAIVFSAFMFIFVISGDYNNRKVNDLEKKFVDLAQFLSFAMKWIFLGIIAFSLLSLIIGWVASLSATTIIIILLVLILLKN